MSADLVILIKCDIEGCASSFRTKPPGGMRAARAKAAKAGWDYFAKRDFCPIHKNKPIVSRVEL